MPRLYVANLWFVVSMQRFVSFVCLGIVRDIHWCLVLLLTVLWYFRLSFSLLFRLYFLILCRSFCPICSLRYGFFSVVCFHWCFVVWMKIINELCGCLMWHTTICLPILWQWYIGNFLVFFQFIRCKLKCMNVLCYCYHYNFFVLFQLFRYILKCPTVLCYCCQNHSLLFCPFIECVSKCTTILCYCCSLSSCNACNSFDAYW